MCNAMKFLHLLHASIGFPLLRCRSAGAFIPRLAFSTRFLQTINTANWTNQRPTLLCSNFSSINAPTKRGIIANLTFSKSLRTSSIVAAASSSTLESEDDPSQHSSDSDEDDEDLEDTDFSEEEEEDLVGDEDEEESVGMEINTAGTEWGEAALAAVNRLLSSDDTLDIYSFRAFPGNKRLDIRIDKLTNQYGSPSLDEVGQFSKKLNAELEAALGEEVAGDIEIEVSSPGAERLVKVPEELSRFGELPMKVEYETDDGIQNPVLQYQETSEDGTMTRWKLANVRANRSGKGRPLNKKQRETVIEIAVGAIKQTNLHVDV